MAVVCAHADGDAAWLWQPVDPLYHADPLAAMQVTFNELRVLVDEPGLYDLSSEMGTGATFATGHSTAGIGIRSRPRLSVKTAGAHAPITGRF